jgi:3-oxoacyl-[acyl-carrier protein] reductase
MSKTMLITGSSTGIGAATAVELASGNFIFIHYNSSERAAKEVAEKVRGLGGEAVLVKADLRTEKGCNLLYNRVTETVTKLDLLVNNAGGLVRRETVEQISWESMLEIFALNTFSAMMMTRLCVPLLKKGTDPCIVNLTSVAIRTGAPTATIYGASKGALDSFTRGCAKELAPDIRVNAVAPGVIPTPFHEKYTTPERMESFRESTPVKHHGTSGQIARAIRYLAENDYLTGETIDVNGGLFMR